MIFPPIFPLSLEERSGELLIVWQGWTNLPYRVQRYRTTPTARTHNAPFPPALSPPGPFGIQQDRSPPVTPAVASPTTPPRPPHSRPPDISPATQFKPLSLSIIGNRESKPDLKENQPRVIYMASERVPRTTQNALTRARPIPARSGSPGPPPIRPRTPCPHPRRLSPVACHGCGHVRPPLSSPRGTV